MGSFWVVPLSNSVSDMKMKCAVYANIRYFNFKYIAMYYKNYCNLQFTFIQYMQVLSANTVQWHEAAELIHILHKPQYFRKPGEYPP